MDLVTGLERSSRRPRRPQPGIAAHAVPRQDRTRTALCGASIVAGHAVFDPAAASACPDCAALLPQPLAKAG